MKKKTKVILLYILLALAVIFIAGASFALHRMVQGLRRIIVWENLHNTLYDCRKKFAQSNPVLSSDPAHPSDVTHLLTEKDYVGGKLDYWNTAVKIYFIRAVNNQLYGKAVSAGPDRIFGTGDDVVTSEFDDTGTIYANVNSLENDLKQQNQNFSSLR